MRIILLIPSYQSSNTILQTLNSVETQSNIARLSMVVLADDCSTDDSVDLVQRNWSLPVPLRVISQGSNVGERANVNHAIAQLGEEADWVLILHADDLAKPNWLTHMVARIENCPEEVGSICSSWDEWLPDDSIVPGEDASHREVELIPGKKETVVGTLKKGCWWHISGCAIRLNAFRDVKEFNRTLPQLGDWEWLLRLLSKGWAVEYIPRTLITYREHSGSVSHSSFKSNRDIEESLGIVRNYTHLLSRRDLVNFHVRRSWYLSRRFLRALTQLRLEGCVSALTGLGRTGHNLYRCLGVQN